MTDILIIQSDKQIGQQIAASLMRMGHSCRFTQSQEVAIEYANLRSYALIIIDAELPWTEDFIQMEYIAQRAWPILFVTCDASKQDTLMETYKGPCRVLLSPFFKDEMLYYVKSVLKDCERRLTIGNFELKMIDKTACYGGKSLDLTAQEFSLLQVLLQNRGSTLSREHLLKMAWGYQMAGDSRTVDVHVQRLRKKIGDKECIQTIYKKGYRLLT